MPYLWPKIRFAVFNFIIWDVSPEIVTLGPVTLRWYGLLFATGFLLGQQVLIRLFRAEGKPESDVEVLTIYMVLSTVVGARLGHCLFYQPEYYFSSEHWLDIFKIWEGGLASHGAAVVIFPALYFYARSRKDQSYLWITDRMVITVALAGFCIRMGNLMNSEIIGKPSDAPWAFAFAFPEGAKPQVLENNPDLANIRVSAVGSDTAMAGVPYAKVAYKAIYQKGKGDDMTARVLVGNTLPNSLVERYAGTRESVALVGSALQPSVGRDGGRLTASFRAFVKTRHPAQLYEALSYLALFFFLYWFWARRKAATPEGSLTGLFMALCFGMRFCWEFLKENQVDKESDIIAQLGLNIGQLLSIPAVLFGLTLLVLAQRNARRNPPNA